MSDYDDVWMRTVTVVEKEKDSKPLIYKPDGTALVKPRQPFGFVPPKKVTK